jgi:hypothetical protein
MHQFDESLQLQPASGETHAGATVFLARTSDRYKNAIGPFGGWTVALLLKSVLRMPDVRGEPLALDAMLMGAIADGDLEVRVYPVRQNRSVGFWRTEAWQAGRICAHAQVTLSTARKSIVLQDAQFPDVPAADTVRVYDNPRKTVPWIDQYIFKPVRGMLFSRAESMDARLWIRDAEPRALDALSLTAICDTSFPPTWIRLAEQTPISTVAFSVYYRAGEADLAEADSGFTLLDSKTSVAQNGYVDQFTSVWSASGRLLAHTQQMLWFADTPTV